jgi:type IV pilus assembly protein PilA
VFTGSGEDDAVALVHGVSGAPKGEKVGDVAGHAIHRLDGDDVHAAVLGDTLALGRRSFLEVALKAAAGQEPRLAGSNEPLASLLTSGTEDAAVVVAAVLNRLPEQLRGEVAGHGVERARVTVGTSGIFAVAEGDPAKLEALAGQARAAINMAKMAAEAEKERAKAGDDVAEGIAAILGYHGAVQLARSIDPKVEQSKLTIGLPLVVQDPTVVVAIMGILSAIAIPAFVKYTRRAKTSEARIGLAKVFDGVSKYYAEHGRCPSDGEGSAGITPPLALDCNDGPGGRCVPSETAASPGYYPIEAWTDNPVWSALRFQQEQAHYFHYDVRWNQGPQGCQFTAQAFGDLDDDGIYSTYERAGAANAHGVNAAAGLYIDKEVE